MQGLYPLTFAPQYKSYVWGGDSIRQRFNRENTPFPCAESWEISTVPGNISVITNGAFAGAPFDNVVRHFGTDLLGKKVQNPEAFPLLIKLLDVHDRLSVQVHPDNNNAALLGGQPKHEMWYFLDAEENARVFAGLTPGANKENYLHHLREYRVEKEQVYDIQPGTCHALIGPSLIYEVQQTSDTTYRLYDWGRARELHIEQALQCIDWQQKTTPLGVTVVSSHHLIPRLRTQDFAFGTLQLLKPYMLHANKESFIVLFCAKGKLNLKHSYCELTLQAGNSVLIPSKQTVQLIPQLPSLVLLTTL